MRLPIFAALAGALFLSACIAPTVDVRQAPVLTPIAFQANGDQARPFTFMSLEFNIRRGQDIGSYQSGRVGSIICFGNARRITWDRGRTAPDMEWADRFYEVFRDLRYPVVGNPANPLERERERSRAEYVVVGQVTNLGLSVCDQKSFWDERLLGMSGAGWMEVNWQVQSLADRRVVFEGKTEGTGVVEQATFGGWAPIVLAAFEAAAQNLGANQEFHRVVSGERAAARAQQAAAQSAARATLALNGPTQSRAPIATSMGVVRSAVPTIELGEGHGSGVFITEDGYLLTNEHVVRERRQVTVRLQGGVEVIGDVLRTDEMRDIALVKVNLSRAPAVPIRRGTVNVGEEVYAVGTPLRRGFAQTVSRGIVSALRNDTPPGATRSFPRIQSDVMIQGGNSGGGLFDRNGNLIAITFAGFGQTDHGINFFVPIDDALETLQINLSQEPRVPLR